MQRAVDETEERDPVDRRPGLLAGDVEDRRRNVLKAGDPAVGRSGGKAGSSHDQRHSGRRLVRDTLAPLDPMLSVHVAVVGGEDDVGVVKDSEI